MDSRFAFADRAALDAATHRFLRRRSGFRPDLRLLECDGELAVAKDWGEAPWLNRPHGRWSLRREWRALRRLEGVPGVPRPLHRLRHGIIISFLDGKPLSSQSDREISEAFFATLEARVAEIHARGVVHLDLRQRRNILIGRSLRLGAARAPLPAHRPGGRPPCRAEAEGPVRPRADPPLAASAGALRPPGALSLAAQLATRSQGPAAPLDPRLTAPRSRR
jgi:hypothetical protein